MEYNMGIFGPQPINRDLDQPIVLRWMAIHQKTPSGLTMAHIKCNIEWESML